MSSTIGTASVGVLLVPLVHAAYVANREYLAPWEPHRPDSFFTVAGQAERIAERLREFAERILHDGPPSD
ncbi:hypothetical protein M878_43425 [Streptomyces roseochromogenus subsp. oscitans DS 12.976]|uniref:Uncharacterized protein n=1 Tax=Streptomyces roseochromogenus subsp. oscitans DS 12.976 TaxID=1352936 RepID=V6JIY6_STRRC|nr:hypothetical protein M878_43425 [Streptomyces roseochromogenus subsp. oscitans DS 12.976]